MGKEQALPVGGFDGKEHSGAVVVKGTGDCEGYWADPIGSNQNRRGDNGGEWELESKLAPVWMSARALRAVFLQMVVTPG